MLLRKKQRVTSVPCRPHVSTLKGEVTEELINVVDSKGKVLSSRKSYGSKISDVPEKDLVNTESSDLYSVDMLNEHGIVPQNVMSPYFHSTMDDFSQSKLETLIPENK